MPSPEPTDRSRELPELWQRWSEIVMRFALKRRDRNQVSPAYYEALYRELLATCRQMAESDQERREHYESLVQLIGPWLTTRILERTDRSFLLDLWQRCQDVDREMGLRTSPRTVARWVLRLLVFIAVVGIAVAAAPLVREHLGGTLEDVWRIVRNLVLSMTLMQKLLATGIVVALLGGASVIYMRRV